MMDTNDDNLSNNPFASLVSGVNPTACIPVKEDTSLVADITDLDSSQNQHKASTISIKTKKKISKIIEQIFLITIDKVESPSRPKSCVFLADLNESLGEQRLLDEDCVEQALFERLMLPNATDHLTNTGKVESKEGRAEEPQVFHYLCQSYIRSKSVDVQNEDNKRVVEKCCSAIITNSCLCLTNPEIFEEQQISQQFVDVYFNYLTHEAYDKVCMFLNESANAIYKEVGEGDLKDVFMPLLDRLFNDINTFSLIDFQSTGYILTMDFFCTHQHLAVVFMHHNKRLRSSNGRAYENTLLGRLLALSCVSSPDTASNDTTGFFYNPSSRSKVELDRVENDVQQLLSNVCKEVYNLMYKILKQGPRAKNMLLSWVANCLHSNVGKAKLWTGQTRGVAAMMYVSDGFMLNLCHVLLRLCQPFCDISKLQFPSTSAKILKVSPTYCTATDQNKEEREKRNVHCLGLSKETCLVPQPDEGSESPDLEDSYNFITEIFFMTHHALALGFHVVQEFFMQLNQELSRLQNQYQEIQMQGAQNTEVGEQITRKMDVGMAYFLSYKASLTQPDMLEMSFNFNISTSVYLCHLAANRYKSQQPLNRLTFPLNDDVPLELTTMPEFVASNVVDLLLFLRRFKMIFYQTQGPHLNHLLTFIMTFMGSSNRMRNPHMRAHLAEALEALMPNNEESSRSLLASFNREDLFRDKSLASHLSHTLLNVFVSIEMSSENVEFEMKFNYRRPMYAVLKYIWSIELHQRHMISLADEAEKNIEDSDPPLFLRFINLLVNDSIFLLDEALSYMAQIKEQQQSKDAGEWSNLPPAEQQQNESNLRQISMLARFHNMMGAETIGILDMLTRKIQSIFTHAVMRDRIAAMLNYFLYNLVGPKKKNIKVKDFSKYKFDPRGLVRMITQIYINLRQSDPFCLAVCSDGRSYSNKWFQSAINVLQVIKEPIQKIMLFQETADKIDKISAEQSATDAALEDAPQEFLDPLMGTLMKDPVVLPSSGLTVDRTTIARHLLSDQTDPYNRSALTMDMVEPDHQLQAKIIEWMKKMGVNEASGSQPGGSPASSEGRDEPDMYSMYEEEERS